MAKIENSCFYRGKLRGVPLCFHQNNSQTVFFSDLTEHRNLQVILRSGWRSFIAFRATFLPSLKEDAEGSLWQRYMESQMS